MQTSYCHTTNRRLFLVSIFLLASSFAFTQTCNNQGFRLNRLRAGSITKDTVKLWIENDLEFIKLKPHDTVADIGSFQGYFPATYSIFSDSVVFYLNDVNAEGFEYLDSIKIECERIKGVEVTNQFNVVIGTEYSTELPSNQFNKVVVRDAIHHFKYPDSILIDIKRIMKPNARLIVYEPLKNPEIDNKTLCKGSMTKEEFLELMSKSGFKLTEKRSAGNDRCWFVFKIKD